jgi:hypothetical protein
MALLIYSITILFITKIQIIPPVMLILTAAFLINMRLLLGPGYKRYPFWINLILGNSAVLVTLLGNQIPLISNDGFILASVPVFFGLAWFCTGQMYLNSKRFAFIIPLIVISFSLGANMRGETRSLELCSKNLKI